MPSLHPGFEYDIFISYRQKDNKYDGWVTEFVRNLRKELEATFKEDVSIYFDENPHDGLLETHSVDQSLKGKLKSLILLPIISRTYCDPKSFAWEHEFVAFAQLAKTDILGMHVTLPNGNVASRILPIRIHELEREDIDRVEEVTGEAIRPVDFIYRLPGVNRELRTRDDDQIKSPHQVLYRDQVNKVAQAIREIIVGIRGQAMQSGERDISGKSRDETPRSSSNFIRRGITAMFVLLLALAGFFGYRAFAEWRDREHAKNILIPAIRDMVGAYDFAVPSRAFELATEASKYIPEDSFLVKSWPRFSRVVWLNSDPVGALVSWKDYERPADPWKVVGTTPLDSVRIPLGIRMKVEKPGYETVVVTTSRIPRKGKFQLDSVSKLPENMVRIPGRVSRLGVIGLEHHEPIWLNEFLIDRYEVSNEAYARFVEAGGYERREFWNIPFIRDGQAMQWELAVREFVDQTGRPGPSTWESGNFPDGSEKHPVAGISFYEAAAFAAFAGKQLPTVYHWAQVTETNRANVIIPLSNFSGVSTSAVGSREGISTFGIHDLGGNVREWCFNEVEGQPARFILGGGWNDASYAFNDAYGASPMDRSAGNGFRCIKLFTEDTTLQAAARPLQLAFRDYKSDKPVDDKVFEIIERQFRYDKSPLRAKEEQVADTGMWKVRKVTMDAAYGDEKLTTYLFIPRNVQPPYQPILYFPGSQVIFLDDIDSYEVLPLDFILKSGRVLVYPVYKGTYTRKDDGLKSDIANESVAYRDHVIMWRKDLGRVLDYLETREDFSTDHVGYFGVSWGASVGPILCALEPRIDAIVVRGGGLSQAKALPEADMINFLPRVRQPILLINGRYDNYHPVETSQKPMVDLLATPAADKRYVVFETGHQVPRLEHIRETLQWFDRYLGKPK